MENYSIRIYTKFKGQYMLERCLNLTTLILHMLYSNFIMLHKYNDVYVYSYSLVL